MLLERKELDDAETEFRRAIQIDPKNSDAFVSIGTIQLLRSQPTEAVTTFSHAIQLEPEKADGYGGRATAYLALGQTQSGDCRISTTRSGWARRRPENYRNRGTAYSYLGNWKQALEDVETAVRIAPNDTESQLLLAWMLATCPEARLRDGRRAVASATRACELTQWKVAHPIAALAAAYGESGDFQNAVKWQQKAIELSPGNDPASRTYRIALERYRARKPYHRLGVLEEWGIRKYQPVAKTTRDTSVRKTSGTTSNQP